MSNWGATDLKFETGARKGFTNDTRKNGCTHSDALIGDRVSKMRSSGGLMGRDARWETIGKFCIRYISRPGGKRIDRVIKFSNFRAK